MVEEIIGRLPGLTGAQLGRLEEELRRERQRRASSAAGKRPAPRVREEAHIADYSDPNVSLTLKRKVCASFDEPLRAWAQRRGIEWTRCRTCLK